MRKRKSKMMMNEENMKIAPLHHTQLMMMISLNPRKELVAPTLPPSPDLSQV